MLLPCPQSQMVGLEVPKDPDSGDVGRREPDVHGKQEPGLGEPGWVYRTKVPPNELFRTSSSAAVSGVSFRSRSGNVF